MRTTTNLLAAFIVATYLLIMSWIGDIHGIVPWKAWLIWFIIGSVGFLFLQVRDSIRRR